MCKKQKKEVFMTVKNAIQVEINARNALRREKKVYEEQRIWGTKEANRLNRLNAEGFRAYKKALLMPNDVAKKDRRAAIIDKLHDLAWYTYEKEGREVNVMKPHVKNLLAKPPKIGNPMPDVRPVLTRDMLLDHVYYDPANGTFEINRGRAEGNILTYVKYEKRKPPRKDRKDDRTLRPKNYVPKHSGYNRITEQVYLTIYERELAAFAREAVIFNNPKYIINEKDFTVFKRSYYIRVPKSENSPRADKRVDYYLKQIAPLKVVHVPPMASTYAATKLAYLCMGAGGNWDYSQGIDNAVRVNTDRAPEGMRYYSIKTNKPIRIPCRDSDKLNIKWDNIKPYEVGEQGYISPSQIAKVPEKKVRHPQPVRKVPYSYAMNIKEIIYETAPTTPCYYLQNMGNPPYSNYDYEGTKREFHRRIEAMPGSKQMLRNGNIMVTTPAKTRS